MSFENRYSKIDRFLHSMAFTSIGVQKALADIEDSIYKKNFSSVEIDRPIFITSLPRSGTTLLLEIVGSLDGFISHSYRNMPFLLLPLLWNKISGRFQKSGGDMERAHGDGLNIGYDSIEAFEEILWHAFWKEKYANERIELWHSSDKDETDEFAEFVHGHLKKILSLHANEGQQLRYVSKNNANISRIEKLKQLFPDAIVLIPFRNPVDHVSSMLRQHNNFLSIHAEDAFAKRYMSDIGHFDFGANFLPINFDHWLDKLGHQQQWQTANQWLEYWCAGCEHICSKIGGNVFLIDYDDCCTNPNEWLGRIGQAMGMEDPQPLLDQSGRFRASTSYKVDDLDLDKNLLERALQLHKKMQALSRCKP